MYGDHGSLNSATGKLKPSMKTTMEDLQKKAKYILSLFRQDPCYPSNPIQPKLAIVQTGNLLKGEDLKRMVACQGSSISGTGA